MSFVVRNSVKILLLNDNNELLLLHVDDPQTTSVDGTYHGPFWHPIGGGIESGETIQEAAIREIYEETGLKKEEVTLGPVVWCGEFDLVLAGTLTRINMQFMVAKTKKEDVHISGLIGREKDVAKKVEWLTLEKIKNCSQVIYPVVLLDYLPGILAGNYPEEPIEIDLGKQPE
ncbi:NUDIX domain-containing protein [Candidatus Dependentiae bacterium]